MSARLLAALLAGASLALAAVPALAEDGPVRAFTGDDLFRLEAARDVQVSPDGATIAWFERYRTNAADKK